MQINSQSRLPFQQISPELNFVSAQGHLLLVNLGSELLAIDTLRSQGNGNPVLWTQELTELGPNMFNGQPIQAKEIPLPWGASRHVPAPVDGGQTIGIVGPLLDRCVLVERSRDLTAFDPVTGETLWSRRGIEPGSEIFGDEEVLVIVPPDTAGDSVQATILRSMDGEELGTRKLPKSIHRWAYCGRRCLAGRVESDGRLSFVLSDPWKDKELVLATFKSGVKATLIGDDAAAFLEPSGRFLMVALADGSHMIDQQLEPEDALDNIVVQRTPDQYVLFANRASRGSSPNMPTPQGMVGLDSGMALANGHIYCVRSRQRQAALASSGPGQELSRIARTRRGSTVIGAAALATCDGSLGIGRGEVVALVSRSPQRPSGLERRFGAAGQLFQLRTQRQSGAADSHRLDAHPSPDIAVYERSRAARTAVSGGLVD